MTIGAIMTHNVGNFLDKKVIGFAFKTLTGQHGTLQLPDCTSIIVRSHPHAG